MKTGVITKIGGMHWDIRPAPKWGTIEVRVFDGVSTRAELGALVALVHCLIVDLDRRLSAGETLPNMQPWHVKENKCAQRDTDWTPRSSSTPTQTSASSLTIWIACSTTWRRLRSHSAARTSWRRWRTFPVAARPTSGNVVSRKRRAAIWLRSSTLGRRVGHLAGSQCEGLFRGLEIRAYQPFVQWVSIFSSHAVYYCPVLIDSWSQRGGAPGQSDRSWSSSHRLLLIGTAALTVLVLGVQAFASYKGYLGPVESLFGDYFLVPRSAPCLGWASLSRSSD